MGDMYSDGELSNMIKSLGTKRVKDNKNVYKELIYNLTPPFSSISA